MDVTIAEELLLLAYRDDTGKPLIGSTELDAGLAGALLADLFVARRLGLEGGKVVVLDPAPTGDEELDAVLAHVAADHERKPAAWVSKIKSMALRKRLLSRLAGRGVLSERSTKVLGLFPSRSYPEQDPAVERAVRARLAGVLAGAEPDERSAVLIGVLNACKLDRKLFPEADRRRVKEVVEGDWAGPAVAKTIAAVNAALMAGVVAATTVAVTSGTVGS
ncbi:GPP34 family phosphoprotein [Sphaerisporangium sp. NPDC051011]|uniref:GOLPH3/VPS74 family protein n=1 Tax=Sphaerisporangium sp. NPDC051011 TaxID=3155792 RepID=UPI0033D67EE4